MLVFENTNYVCCGLFSAADAWKHPDVVIDTWEVIYVLSGTVYIRVDDRAYAVKKNGALLMPPHVRHAGYQESTDVSFYWIHFDGCPLQELLVPDCDSYHLSLLTRQVMHYHGATELWQEECNYLGRLILMEIYRQSAKTSVSNRVHEVAEWIRIHGDRQLSVTQIAKRFHYNPDYLNRLFQKEFGQSLKSFMDTVRMGQIKTMLLNTTDPLQVVAQKCDFEDYKYFLKFFKRHQGISPSAFRNIYYNVHLNDK